MNFRNRLAYLASAFVFAACGGGNDSGSNNSGNSINNINEASSALPTDLTPASVVGMAVASDNGQPLANVQVTAAGKSVTTAADGSFRLDGIVVSDRIVLRFAKTGYVDGFATAATRAAGTNNVIARMSSIAVSTTFESSNGTTLTDTNSAASVALAPGSLIVAATGAAPQGPVTASIAVIDPSANPANMPGDYQTNTGSTIESFGALSVQLRDSAGNRLNLAPGQFSTIRIPLLTRSETPAPTIPLYYFNESSGLWVEEGSATLAGAAPNQYYEGVVRHFTVWNADIAVQTVFVNGCVVDPEGQPLNFLTVRSEGMDYSGFASSPLDAQGKFRVAVRRNGTAKIDVVGLRLSFAALINPSAADSVLPNCLTLQPSTTPLKPALLSEPRSLSAQTGSAVTFGVIAAGPELKYEWLRNGQPIVGATRPFYTVYPITEGDNGVQYSVRVFNQVGSVTSNTAALTVLPGLSPEIGLLMRLISLPFSLSNLGYAPLNYFTEGDDLTWINPALTCAKGSATGSLNGQPIPADTTLATGNGTVVGIFNNCVSNANDPDATLTGTATVNYTADVGLRNGSVSAQFTQMRRVSTDDSILQLGSDLTGNGSLSSTTSTTLASGKKTSITKITFGIDSSLRSNKTGQVAVFKSGSLSSTSVETIASEQTEEVTEQDNITYVLDGDIYVVNGTLRTQSGRGILGGSGQLVLTKNGVRAGRVYATQQGQFYEINGKLQPFD